MLVTDAPALPHVHHIRASHSTGLQQRNGRKTLTTVQGLPDKYDPKKLLKAMKKEFACNGHVVASADDSDDESSPAPTAAKGADFGRVLQFQGDQRLKVKDFLVSCGLISEKEAKDQIVMWVPRTSRANMCIHADLCSHGY